jgi:hypothetical protein
MHDTHRESVLLRLIEYETKKDELKQQKQQRCQHKFTILGRVHRNTGIQSRTCELCSLKLTQPLWKWYHAK